MRLSRATSDGCSAARSFGSPSSSAAFWALRVSICSFSASASLPVRAIASLSRSRVNRVRLLDTGFPPVARPSRARSAVGVLCSFTCRCAFLCRSSARRSWMLPPAGLLPAGSCPSLPVLAAFRCRRSARRA